MKISSVISFFVGIAVTLGFSTLRGSNSESSQHVYELRLYHVNQGKMAELVARFGNHTDAIFKRHNMKSVGYWSPEDAPSAQNLFVYILEHPSRQEAERNWAAFRADPEMAEGEGRIGEERAPSGAYRPVFHGSDELFGSAVINQLCSGKALKCYN
jgi:NIPSNAP